VPAAAASDDTGDLEAAHGPLFPIGPYSAMVGAPADRLPGCTSFSILTGDLKPTQPALPTFTQFPLACISMKVHRPPQSGIENWEIARATAEMMARSS